MAVSSLAYTMLGMEPPVPMTRPVEQDINAQGLDAMLNPRPRAARRATSHYNTFQTVCSSALDSPPNYTAATRQRLDVRRPREGEEVLPKYRSTVNCEAKVLLFLESINPLHGVSESDWREVYVVVRGTLFSVHRVKDGGPGKLLRSYTLQHAEVGLAADTQHTILVPQTRLAHLIPVAARRRAWQKDPEMFKTVRQNLLRLRVETDQMLLADANEERIHDLIGAVSAGIDISFAIDERNIPRQCTVPRRRRRQRGTGDLNDPSLLAEQQRILEQMYPDFAEQHPTTTSRPQLDRTTTVDTTTTEARPTPAQEDEDLDLAVMREDFANPNAPAPTQPTDSFRRPGMIRQTTASSLASTFSTDMIYASSPDHFNSTGKWQPPHPCTTAQIQRYTRRCMPVLLAEAVRASDVLICGGKRVRINWRMELLEEWELKPPSYRSHRFEVAAPTTVSTSSQSDNGAQQLQRSPSHSSQTPSCDMHSSSPLSARSAFAEREDQIEATHTGLAQLELTKSGTGMAEKSLVRGSAGQQDEGRKLEVRRVQGRVEACHGVVFCF
ncbi:hypothetical protein LTR62_005306 [Meristemomyces frigidus]|uniref:Uncharacterized protein n=1 Tax=Meristemomyces frigidus TaxID=1508187 RepID=A0AAN7YJE9_9PEZI|nr:hypothetical protein LTR62_005306 [Meristemomyces frigidus]